jgi:RNA polymerase sigma-B factor
LAGCRDEFAALAATTEPAARAALRDRIVKAHLGLAYAIAGRYRRLGPGFEDIRQTAALALVEAVHRFDPGRDTAFSGFAVPTISGALKHHFRDQGWMVHPPRRIKEVRLRIRAATDLLTQQLRHAPTVTDLADHLDCSPQEIREALCTEARCGRCRSTPRSGPPTTRPRPLSWAARTPHTPTLTTWKRYARCWPSCPSGNDA